MRFKKTKLLLALCWAKLSTKTRRTGVTSPGCKLILRVVRQFHMPRCQRCLAWAPTRVEDALGQGVVCNEMTHSSGSACFLQCIHEWLRNLLLQIGHCVTLLRSDAECAGNRSRIIPILTLVQPIRPSRGMLVFNYDGMKQQSMNIITLQRNNPSQTIMEDDCNWNETKIRRKMLPHHF